MVLPRIDNPYLKTKINDQLPQSGDGKTIMTMEPKFVPDESVKIKLQDNVETSVRLVDCVGFPIPGVLGLMEENKIRMVKTPWDDSELPFDEVAKRGTEKVITDYSTVGIVVTTDGTIGELKRESFLESEVLTIEKLKLISKPFVVILNSTMPTSLKTIELSHSMEKQYGVPVLPINCKKMNEETIEIILKSLLNEFPVEEINIKLPVFLDALENNHWIKISLINDFKRLCKCKNGI